MATIRVEVVYALPEGLKTAMVTLQNGATVRDALAASGLAELSGGRVGIFGKRVTEDTALADGDRVEIYRALAMDPKEARRLRAKRARGRR